MSKPAGTTNVEAPEQCKRPPAVNVFIADASRMGCQLMAAALCRSRYRLAVAGYATNSDEIRWGLGENETDIAVIGAQLKEGAMAGFNVTREVRASHPRANVIMMLDSIERATVVEAFRAGATGIFSRDESFELLCKCIHAVHQGQVWASSKELRFLLDVLTQSPPTEAVYSRLPSPLTRRERGVVQLVAEGLTNRDISRQLNLSEHTVRNYLFRIFNKVGTSNRLELALYALNRRERTGSEIQRTETVCLRAANLCESKPNKFGSRPQATAPMNMDRIATYREKWLPAR
jgi:two-component system nitrate/nitrite response regulator NarL